MVSVFKIMWYNATSNNCSTSGGRSVVAVSVGEDGHRTFPSARLDWFVAELSKTQLVHRI